MCSIPRLRNCATRSSQSSYIRSARISTTARPRDWFMATALATRDRIVDHWMDATRLTNLKGHKRVYYLSLEFLLGRLLADGLRNLHALDTARHALAELGIDFDEIVIEEPDAALGNGGLGRLAACFMDSMALVEDSRLRLRHPLRFWAVQASDHEDGNTKLPEDWLSFGNPWEFERPEVAISTSALAALSNMIGSRRRYRARHMASGRDAAGSRLRHAGVGWRGRHANTLRLWSARVARSDPSRAFNRGDHVGALAERDRAEAISRVLYPERLNARRPGTAAAAGVFLCLGLAAGPCAPPYSQHGDFIVAAESCHPAQRHAPRDRGRRAHAAPRRRCTDAAGHEAWDITRRTRSLHEPHAAAGGAGDLAGRADGAAAAAAHADHLRDQRAASSTRCARPATMPRRRCRFADRRAMATGASAWAISPSSARTRSTASPRCIPSSCAQTVFRDLHAALSRPHRQQDQRHHVRGAGCQRQSASDRRCSARRSAPASSTIRCISSALEPLADDAAFREQLRRRAARNKDAARRV